MNGSGGKRSPLVADRRYAPASARASKPGSPPPPPKKPKAPAKPPRKPRAARPRGLIARFVRFIWRILWGVAWRLGFVMGLILAGAVFYFYSGLPPLEALLDGRHRGSVTLLDREDQVFAWRGETFGGQITADTVSADLRNAIVATEDKRFYHHFGVSPRGIASAISINLSEGRGPLEGNGGSTITQQVAKLLCLGVVYDPAKWKTEADYEADCRAGGVWRKIKEIPYAMALEAKYGKDAVLTIYLNRAYLGAGARGFEAASQRYFGKSAANVGPAESAMLAGLLKAPSRYAPTTNLKRAQGRAEVILGLMHDQGYLDDAQYADALAHPAQLSRAAAERAGGYFADWVMESGPAFLTSETTEDVVIRTTLDQRLQKAAEEALAYVFDTKLKEGSKAQAAVVVMSADGAVRAMVGGRDLPNAGDFNRATQALRQTGSTFKPFVYAAALDMGYTMNSIVEDAPLTIWDKGSRKNWSPQNYSKEYRGPITLTEALANSINTATVRVSEAVGRDAVRKVATDFGFASNLAEGPSLALGVSESTLIEMTGAYAGILNGGTAVKPYGLVSLGLKGDPTPLIGQEGGMGERVISENAARQLIAMMNRVIDGGTGGRARLPDREAAGKTGTTQAARDAWFIGFTADYVVGVWMGYDDNTPLSGVTGGGLPAEIWREVMVRVSEGLPPRPLPMVRPGDPLTPPAYGGETWGADSTGGATGAEPWATDPGGWPAEGTTPPAGTIPEGAPPDVAEQILLDVLGGGN